MQSINRFRMFTYSFIGGKLLAACSGNGNSGFGDGSEL